ncbi:MAG: TetR family transcriptional regulator [Deltaproteobacteria bacterium]|nr:TetR family transcriptional regulator [Deltaproteobacteria bacterium]MBW2049104.1 TetR family transcriptional regulator [Deltaproteobacteria bacterium]MBW2111041.1 TetR family transcriptional regulator [Deltaproteobacteria bacterium]MBW2354173.1 TetR family transcriptional regulator [Deltaproteobacteria bacterium]HDZ90974.1 TetR/AcrR family transcriptional regulator [Deltaproteobacteria bacterium]
MPRPKDSRRIREIEAVSARLFARKGYRSTSLREIARELGMDKSSLYHYFSGKEEMLFKLMNSAMDDAMKSLEEICAADLSPEEKLQEILSFYTRYFAGDQDRETLLVNEMNSLSANYRDILIEKQKSYVNLFKSVLFDLDRAHRLKEIHPTVATFAFFGMVHYTIKWYRQDGPVKIDKLADLFVQIFTRGILK